MLVKSLIRKSGKFVNDQKQEINYDNLIFTCEMPDNEGRNVFGPNYKDVKIKFNEFVNSFKGDLKSIENKDATFFFDADGHYIGCNIK